MTKILFTLLFTISFTQAHAATKTFKMTYEVVKAKAVCWQTCRDSWCEESDFDIFFDPSTYKKLQTARKKGMSWSIGGLKCEDDIAIVDEHMPALQKNNPKKASKILKAQGTDVNLVLYTNITAPVTNFVENLLEELNEQSIKSEKELLEELASTIENSKGLLWGGEVEIFKIKKSVKSTIAEYQKDFNKKYGKNDEAEFLINTNLKTDWLLGGCSACVDALKALVDSGEVATTLFWSNGMDEDYITYNIVILLKNGSALSIYLGN